MLPVSRRRLLQFGSALPLWLPRIARAAGSTAGDRKFLYLFTNGGWDPTYGIAPVYGSPGIDSNPAAESGSVGDISFVDGPQAPHIRSFFQAYADRTCLVHGFEVRSITHERCKRLIMTGKSASTADDWPAQVAGQSGDYLVPHVVISGPSFTAQYTSSVVRLGETGQFAALLDGTALTGAQPASQPLPGGSAEAVARFRASRAGAFAAAAGRGRAQVVGDALVGANARLDLLTSIDDLDLSGGEAGAGGIIPLLPALDALERGYARSAIMSHGGLFDVGWDSHSGIDQQTSNYEVLFEDLMSLMDELDSRAGTNGGSLADETTIVVFSEMGRAPVINATGGKDHWTFTSCMFIGAGIAGGRQIGAYDDNLLGRAVDLASGDLSETGAILGSEHIGATILALADIEPESQPIMAVLA
jgi:hypothetical protein